MKVVRTDFGIKKLAMAAHQHDEEEGEHHEEGDHQETAAQEKDHGIPDPHIWLSPPLVRIQAQAILAALQEADPAHRDVFEANFRTLPRG